MNTDGGLTDTGTVQLTGIILHRKRLLQNINKYVLIADDHWVGLFLQSLFKKTSIKILNDKIIAEFQEE